MAINVVPMLCRSDFSRDCSALCIPQLAVGCPPHQSTGAPSTLDGSRKSSVAIVFDLGNTCQDESFVRTVNTVNRNPVIERIVTTVSPIDLATIADVCDVDDSMEEHPLFPATRSCFRVVFHPQGWLCFWMSWFDCVWRISCPVRALGPTQECVSAVPAIPAKTATLDNLRTTQRDRTDRSSVMGKRWSRFACSLTSRIPLFAPYCSLVFCR
jgi:hypothetical protein